MGFIPDEIIQSVRLQSDIVEVVSRYVQLKKKGKYFTGSCPFHHDHAPSFTVTPDKQIFHCFGCRAGGDVFRFLMLKENLTFHEAVKVLAEQSGIALPSESPFQREIERKSADLRHIVSLAKDFFQHVLQHHEAASPARNYLAGRGLSPEVLERFQVGFALPEWDALLRYLHRKGVRPEEAAEAGLAARRESGGFYDRFRGRVIFSIWDITGREVGFGGRVLDDSLPKYLNTPETAFFNKGRLLYGMHLARPAVREKGHVVVVEGYMDVVTAHIHGVTNAVASLGTALTSEQGRLLMNYSRNVVVAYDADAAGIAATMRSLDLLQELGCQVRVVTIPDGKDPDDFLSKHGYASWEELVNRAPSLIEYKIKQAAETRPVHSVADKLEVIQQIYPNVANLNGEIEREEALKAIARVLNVSWETVVGEFKRFEAKPGKKWTNPDNIAKSKHTIVVKEEKLDTRGKAEAGILRLVLEDPSLGAAVLDTLGEQPFRNPAYQKIFRLCMELSDQPSKIFTYLEDDEQNVLSLLLTREIPGKDPVHIMNGYMDSICRCIRQERRDSLLKEISEAERSGNHWLYRDLWQEYIILRGVAEAEKLGDSQLITKLLQEHQQLLNSNNRKHPKEGSDNM